MVKQIEKSLLQYEKGKLSYDLSTEEQMRRAIAALLDIVDDLQTRVKALEK